MKNYYFNCYFLIEKLFFH